MDYGFNTSFLKSNFEPDYETYGPKLPGESVISWQNRVSQERASEFRNSVLSGDKPTNISDRDWAKANIMYKLLLKHYGEPLEKFLSRFN